MSKIKKLSKDDILKIAAGEVVERPANVIKELLENSLDAKATEIALYIENAGKKLIQIVDNGHGMSEDDATLCIEQHATSKLTTIDDLKRIQTFGFRGEALSSISAVSKFLLKTKEGHIQTGISLTVEQNNILNKNLISCNTGTDISVTDLFYNVPARKKFLKSKETEWRAIVQLFQAFNLAYLNVHFKLYHDGRLIYNNPATDNLQKRIAQIFDSNMAQNILEFESTNENCKIFGAISNTHYYRYDRSNIFLFVNNRWIKDYKLTQAFIRGYQNCLPTDRFPSGAAFILINPELVDVNIHPRKEEVQFLHPGLIQQSLQKAIKERLEKYSTETLKKDFNFPKADFIQKPNITNNDIKKTEVISNFQNNLFKAIAEPSHVALKEPKLNSPIDKSFTKILESSFAKNIQDNNQPQQVTYQENIEIPKQIDLDYQLIGQFFLTYLLIQTQTGLMVIDQHAAHERIVYEKIRKQFNNIEKVKLLFPQTILLNELDIQTALPYLDVFEQFGITLEQIGKAELIVKETPLFLKNQPIEDIVKQAITIIKENNQTTLEDIKKLIHQKIHAQISCKTAIKAGDELSVQSMHQLIKDLYSCDNKLTCPHGRPTIWNMSLQEIEKKFKRDYR